MTEPRKEEGRGEEVEEQPPAVVEKKPGKTMQELERLQFAELERER